MTAGLALLAVGVAVLSQTLGEKTLLYHGKPVFYWSQTLKGQNPAATNEALQVLNQEIIPNLTKTMLEDTNDSKLRAKLVDILNNLPGVQIFTLPSESRRAAATDRLGDFGSAAGAAIPALLQAYQGHDRAVAGPAAVSLARIHAKPDELIPMLVKNLDTEELREHAAKALGEYGSAATSAVPKLRGLLRIQDKDLRQAVTGALRKIDPSALPQGRRPAPKPAPDAPKAPEAADKGTGTKPPEGTAPQEAK